MSKGQFTRAFDGLTSRQQEVLEMFLARKTDEAIAQSLNIAPATVRQHIKDICEAFGLKNEFSDERRSKRSDLMALFHQYMPELVGNKTPVKSTKPEETILETTPEPNFVGREEAILQLNELASQGAKIILIRAKGGVGKTTLARKYLKLRFGSFLEFPIAKETQNITPIESLLEERLRQLNEEPGREFGVSLDRLKRKLQTERIGVLIDNLETALDENGKFIEPHRCYVELLRVLADPSVQSLTLITSRDRLHESDITVWHYPLEGLSVDAWQQYFNNRNIQTNSPALTTMHIAYGGNAKAMEILAGAIQVDYTGDVDQYWQANQGDLLIEADLRDLVTSQFNRLEQHHSQAFKLLCRLGCYRYQDIATVPLEGLLCLLWDVPESQRQRVVHFLLARSLVEFQNGEYWLHPVIRAAAIEKLRESEDWETANRQAAEYWKESIEIVETVEDALRAFEAYYHYVGIEDFDKAAQVIGKWRSNRWTRWESLGESFYRLGFLQQMNLAIKKIMNHIHDRENLDLGQIFNILGDICWRMGNIHDAIQYHEQARQSAMRLEGEFSLRRAAVSIQNIGICKTDLLEIEEAVELFELCISQSDQYTSNSRLKACIFFSKTYLVYLKSCLENQDSKQVLLEEANNLTSAITHTELTTQGRGYGLLKLGQSYNNLGETEKSFEMLNEAIDFAEESHCTQVKAISLYSLAELARKQADFKTALLHHSEAIEILVQIGAKCDLAEAYYQQGLTYQMMEEVEKSRESFDKAIQLFKEIQAPKQVEKVQRARNNKAIKENIK